MCLVVNPASSEYSLEQIALALSGGTFCVGVFTVIKTLCYILVFAVGGVTTFGRVAFLHIGW